MERRARCRMFSHRSVYSTRSAGRSEYVIIFRMILILSDTHTVGVGAAQKGWDPERHICLILNNKAQHLLLSFYSFSTCPPYSCKAGRPLTYPSVSALSWDIMILLLTIIGLRRHRLSTNSTLWSILVTQGIGYMIITCISCVPVLVCLQPIVEVILG